MMKWFVIFLLSNLAGSEGTNADEIVKVNAPASLIVQAGKQSVITVTIDVRDGYHIQANKVKDEFIIPTTLEINGNDKFVVGKQVFPSPRKFKLEGMDTYLEVYDGRFEVSTFFTTAKKVPKKIYHLNGKLNYQACDSIRCFAPTTVEFLMEIDVR